MSLADGSIPESGSTKQAGWDRTIVNSNEASFHQLQALFAFMCAVPGIPVMYYGDEVGMPGANDPDSRRMMRFDSLNSMQLAQRDMFARLARMRRNHLALSYGDVRIISADQESLLLERNYFGKKIVCVFYSGKTPRTFSLSDAPSHSLCGNKVQRTGNEVRLTLAPNRFDYLY